ncbi:hypothetical protein TRFO_01597 [Tritrichomonas foetus]|uniref:Uncharacterized protein n=1 Tax=Tritrichomonas foetus TaxID=1144522 RepID=A0A1J4K295_9EUKA|nr:hypothetical protein TRFO_01597 [Tritrichomonas foetus]|eukprot:OHT03868.1 hypothetical protein TRFO_01597 [Tritrichomonas foetus]
MKSKNLLKNIILSEKLESPAQQQSQEDYLIPRNCWLKITSLQIRPSQLDKNQKIRIRISVPNSARVIRTSTIQLDDNILSALQSSQNQAGYSEMLTDITVLLEYKHDVRFGHQNNLEFDVEVLSSILSRSKTLGSAAIDLSNAIQKSVQTILMFRKDNDTTASIKIQLYSLNLSKKMPPFQKVVNSPVFNSDSDSESIPPITAHFEKTMHHIFAQNKILIMDERTTQGHTLLQNVSTNDFVLPIKDVQIIQKIFDISESEFVPKKEPFRFIIAGDDYFICFILKAFLLMRDRGVLSNDTFSFIHIPLDSKHCKFAHKIKESSQNYSQHYLTENWFTVFQEKSPVQNASAIIESEVNFLIETPLIPVKIRIADILITTLSDQFVAPMFLMLEIGDPNGAKTGKVQLSNIFHLKATYFKKDNNNNKSANLKFFYYALKVHGSQLNVSYKPVQMSSTFPIGEKFEKTTPERKKKSLSKVILTPTKAQSPFALKIDENVFKDVVSVTVSLRNSDSAVVMQIPP